MEESYPAVELFIGLSRVSFMGKQTRGIEKDRRHDVDLGQRQQAFNRLQELHAPSLHRYACSLTRDSARAQDVVQETLLKVWQHPHLLDEPPEQLRGWLFTAARNLVIDQSRSGISRHEFAADQLPEQSVADQADRIFNELLIREALRSLSEDHRQVVIRAYYYAQSVEQIAADLAIPSGTVKSRLHYGMRSLKLALEEKGVGR